MYRILIASLVIVGFAVVFTPSLIDRISGGQPSEKNVYISENGDEQIYSQEELKKMLTDSQYKVTQEDGTEKAFDNEYWDLNEKGIYVDVISGEPLFSSNDKYDPGTGWPSFTKPLAEENIVEKEDPGLFGSRIEIRSSQADSHLGHVFDDGPQPTGLRYCMNSAAMEFIPKPDLEKEGYAEFVDEFK
ncbi:peptide-methionine (R)-S-oxide reductase MsrB [Halobacillus sp. A5]|uniref:peptide-methionine (R)-S-oxide reductase MsrB n=1 Tax=Halobacillus sp. A5 TaxID=2880263 RepID=UPI0020A637AB|nr:peptide-methionine (R)-S-oxide reductase MsrB [Halobacillus sp. A5]MCP3025774.1 peptide-methionine (R)-S-oxide reductase MsrB [Halobacillus sp. A5]